MLSFVDWHAHCCTYFLYVDVELLFLVGKNLVVVNDHYVVFDALLDDGTGLPWGWWYGRWCEGSVRDDDDALRDVCVIKEKLFDEMWKTEAWDRGELWGRSREQTCGYGGYYEMVWCGNIVAACFMWCSVVLDANIRGVLKDIGCLVIVDEEWDSCENDKESTKFLTVSFGTMDQFISSPTVTRIEDPVLRISLYYYGSNWGDVVINREAWHRERGVGCEVHSPSKSGTMSIWGSW